MNLRSFSLACVAFMVLASAAPRLLAQSAVLRPGDSVDVRIANVPPEDISGFSGLYTLDGEGMLNLPYIGLVKAGGMTASAAQLVVQQKLISDQIYTNPTVSITPPAGQRTVTVGGAVRAPGRVPYTEDLTVMSAISAAAGPSDFAGDKIRLVRGGKVQYLSRKKLYKDPSLDPRIEPGDQIEIVQSMF